MGLPRSNVVPAHKPDFYGSVSLAEGPEVKTVVSFPGQYEDDWECLVRRSGERTQLERTVKQPLPSHTPYYKAGSTSCIFLPKGSPFHGSHPSKPDGSGKCWCEDLYGEVQDFGCMWFTVWQTSLQNAVDKKHTLVVVYKAGQKGHGKEGLHWPPQVACTKERRDDAGLGVSQRGETAWLLKQGHNFIEEDINDYRRRLALDFWSELRQTVHHRREQLQQELLGLMKRMHMLSLTAPLNGGLSPARIAAEAGHVPVLQLLYDLGGAARNTLSASWQEKIREGQQNRHGHEAQNGNRLSHIEQSGQVMLELFQLYAKEVHHMSMTDMRFSPVHVAAEHGLEATLRLMHDLESRPSRKNDLGPAHLVQSCQLRFFLFCP